MSYLSGSLPVGTTRTVVGHIGPDAMGIHAGRINLPGLNSAIQGTVPPQGCYRAQVEVLPYNFLKILSATPVSDTTPWVGMDGVTSGANCAMMAAAAPAPTAPAPPPPAPTPVVAPGPQGFAPQNAQPDSPTDTESHPGTGGGQDNQGPGTAQVDPAQEMRPLPTSPQAPRSQPPKSGPIQTTGATVPPGTEAAMSPVTIGTALLVGGYLIFAMSKDKGRRR